MTIPIQMSLHGFIATAPQLNFTGNGAARFYARVGVEHYRKETDGSFTKLDSTFHDMVAYAKTAERAYAKFKVGDNFVASGYISEYEVDRDGQAESREEFVARRIGHDLARTKYEVDRAPSRQFDPPNADLPVAKEPSKVVGL
ncbi:MULTISPECIES: single-stranded DNA-binding protein [unclassified Nocardioides]|uniref:single-stranded DNA-binding protein n=1 Tax=unclassified Nocardioides TaxID=2615069 RepID=UPI0009F0E6D3|nr:MULTISPECIES: single-stranded DNA-binding protein [unclassified Nocardioides]GAW49292.1 Single-strand binding protein [Nocardioides sp. PD653-B2]GAW55780.1 Single-strand binding protein [Nocardioides sp. PD653]